MIPLSLIPQAVIMFVLCVVLQILVVLDYYAAMQGQAVRSAILTGLCATVAAIIVLFYVDKVWMVAVDAAGSAIGAFVAVRYFKRGRTTTGPDG